MDNIFIDNFDMNKMNPSVLNIMFYLHNYLDKGWEINKNNNTYVLKKDECKLLVSDHIKIRDYESADYGDISKYILCFLYNVLNNGWSIKKKRQKYICLKNHEGKKEYLSDNYINTFMKENFNFKLIR